MCRSYGAREGDGRRSAGSSPGLRALRPHEDGSVPRGSRRRIFPCCVAGLMPSAPLAQPEPASRECPRRSGRSRPWRCRPRSREGGGPGRVWSTVAFARSPRRPEASGDRRVQFRLPSSMPFRFSPGPRERRAWLLRDGGAACRQRRCLAQAPRPGTDTGATSSARLPTGNARGLVADAIPGMTTRNF